ncbi:RNB domain-containing ribonuclease [Gandjariella thermophila]|uniref:Ribonuclease R n=1 Tax=Gandjariella thermophila TaxID=1931992 RepID=A0A4D4JC11_9PSEU|nr:RNB domain-containing ribonuclease [Gandjariella thermophila]GDY33134.1 ribonuclease R [Gandjariella thermophila]
MPFPAGEEALDFTEVRAEFGLRVEFPAGAMAEAERGALDGRARLRNRVDATDLPLVTVDPLGSADLDQALLVRRRGPGFRLYHAIADAAAFVRPGGPLDAEARRRGQTLYLPDGPVPLHPTVLSEGAASLLPGQVRPAALWIIDCDRDGEPERCRVHRALVRSVARLDYDTVQARFDAGAPHPSLAALPELGRLRRELALRRGAVELQLPEQKIEPDGDGGWRLAVRLRREAEEWTAEMSILTGICAARLMLDGGVGILRTVPTPEPEAVTALRRMAQALDIPWQDGHDPASVLAGLDPDHPASLALHLDATRLLRGAGYTAFDGSEPPVAGHAGIGAPYAHVTAPLRRLVDRFAAEVCLAVSADAAVPEWARAALPGLPALMATSDALAARVERTCLDQVQAWVLADRVGEVFNAVVLRAEATGAEVFVNPPPVMARCDGEGLPDGERIRVRLAEADPLRRRVRFELP